MDIWCSKNCWNLDIWPLIRTITWLAAAPSHRWCHLTGLWWDMLQEKSPKNTAENHVSGCFRRLSKQNIDSTFFPVPNEHNFWGVYFGGSPKKFNQDMNSFAQWLWQKTTPFLVTPTQVSLVGSCIYLSIDLSIWIYLSESIYLNLYVCMYVGRYVRTYVCMYVYIYVYNMHIIIHIQKKSPKIQLAMCILRV